MNISDALIHTYSVAGRLPDPAARTLIRNFEHRGPLPGPSLGASLLGAITFAGRTIRGAARWYLARRRRLNAIRDLSVLDDRTLSDIGVPRSEIVAIVDAIGTSGPRPVTLASVAVGSAPRPRATANDDEALREAA